MSLRFHRKKGILCVAEFSVEAAVALALGALAALAVALLWIVERLV